MINGHSDEQLLPKGVPFDDYRPPNWDEFFMLKVYLTGMKTIRISIENQQRMFQHKNPKILERKLVQCSSEIDVI